MIRIKWVKIQKIENKIKIHFRGVEHLFSNSRDKRILTVVSQKPCYFFFTRNLKVYMNYL